MSRSILLPFLIVLISIACSNSHQNGKALAMDGDESSPVGCSIDSSIIFEKFKQENKYSWKSILESNNRFQLILYFNESMCIECIDRALRYIHTFPPQDLKEKKLTIVVSYENIRKPMVMIEHHEIDIPTFNCFQYHLLVCDLLFDKPVFLVINSVGKVVNFFDINTPSDERSRILNDFLLFN